MLHKKFSAGVPAGCLVEAEAYLLKDTTGIHKHDGIVVDDEGAGGG